MTGGGQSPILDKRHKGGGSPNIPKRRRGGRSFLQFALLQMTDPPPHDKLCSLPKSVISAPSIAFDF